MTSYIELMGLKRPDLQQLELPHLKGESQAALKFKSNLSVADSGGAVGSQSSDDEHLTELERR